MSEKAIFEALFHKVSLTDQKGKTMTGKMTLYMSEFDSGIGEPCIALENEDDIILTKDIVHFEVVD